MPNDEFTEPRIIEVPITVSEFLADATTPAKRPALIPLYIAIPHRAELSCEAANELVKQHLSPYNTLSVISERSYTITTHYEFAGQQSYTLHTEVYPLWGGGFELVTGQPVPASSTVSIDEHHEWLTQELEKEVEG